MERNAGGISLLLPRWALFCCAPVFPSGFKLETLSEKMIKTAFLTEMKTVIYNLIGLKVCCHGDALGRGGGQTAALMFVHQQQLSAASRSPAAAAEPAAPGL